MALVVPFVLLEEVDDEGVDVVATAAEATSTVVAPGSGIKEATSAFGS